MKYTSLLIPCLLFVSLNAIAGRVTGLVKDDKGQILAYASIMVKGTTRGTTANVDGRYFLNLDSGRYTIICQYVGYSREEKSFVSTGEPFELNF
ncbi:MAG TPA: carboxypeptidase-like regulatory domain-containing protein, partial [Flavitalea sp.]|nr:carboxypeptidase-like regulatory domain-containing protein [Flavitalea sp.]